VLTVLVFLCVLVAAVYAAGEWYRRRDYRERFGEMRGELTSVAVTTDEERDNHLYQTVGLRTDSGIAVTACLKAPAGKVERYPALVILGGLRTGRRTIDYLSDARGLVLLALDYPYEGKKEKLGVLEFAGSLPRIRRAVLETVPAIMLGVDYLLTRDDVDPGRILLAGGSLGALFVPAAAAADERMAAAVILFGAGDIERLVRANLDTSALLAAPAGWLCAVLASPVEPLKYVADVAPRPLFIMSGMVDPRIPVDCSRILQETAHEPKTIRWIDAGHVNVRSVEFHELVACELMEWLVSQGFVEADSLR
jgi:dienelactone hydrolase